MIKNQSPKPNYGYITVKLTDSSVYSYDDIETAKADAINKNQKDPEHPAFYLYKLQGPGKKAKFMGRLTRKFGSSTYEWIR